MALTNQSSSHPTKTGQEKRNTRKNWKRKVVWFNPPDSESVQTNVAKSFLHQLDKHFPKSNIMHKLFNRNNVKVSYSYMPNMASIVKRHNKRILNQYVSATPSDGCYCRVKRECPPNGSCLQSSIAYQVSVNKSAEKKIYIGMTEHTFKKSTPTTTFRSKINGYANKTVLSKYVW